MEEKPNYYAVIPATVRYDEKLRANEKLMYGELTALSNKTGVCYASNNYFARLYKTTPQAISRWILNLKQYGYIEIEYEYEGSVIKKRKIKVSTNIDTYQQKVDGGINICLEGYQQNVKENNTSINNTSINNKENINNKLFIQKKVFKKPTLEEIQAYCKERDNEVDAEYFLDYYESKGWMIGKNHMKDWKACVRTWEKKTTKKKDKKKELEEMYKRLAYLDEEE